MLTPRDPVPQFNVPVNPFTGMPITEAQRRRLNEIQLAADAFYEALHNAEGSAQPGEHQPHTWSTRNASVAATHLETATMWARQEALVNP